ncbi:MAG: ABC transporter substrate-binding protein [Ruminococcaceae bacterium]|jgi:zinc transport system substrate-binding protein|nr:ABC transporter substrate-binding protein [Oscillospiraceae bacterium]
MKRFYSTLLAGCLALFLFAGCSQTQVPASSNADEGQTQVPPASSAEETQVQDEKLSVYASFYPMYDFASKIGGDRANVVNMVPAGTEPHDWEPAAADVSGLETASVFIYNGAGMEHWAEDVLESLTNKDLIAVEASKGVALMEGHHEHEGEEAEHEEEDEDGKYDPHVWLSPLNAKMEMENIKNAFVQADPDNKDYYEANYTKYAADFDTLDKEFQDTLSTLSKKDIIVSHEAFGYLCAAYGLNQVGIEGLAPDSEPDPARMAEIIEFAKENDVKVIFFEELVSPKVSETIAKATGAETQVLNPLEGLSDEELAAGDDYFTVMRQNLEVLKAALQ